MIVEARGFVLRRNWIPVAVSGGLAAVGLLVAQSKAPEAIIGWLMAYFGIVFGPLLFLRNAFPRARPVTVRATAAGVTVDAEEIATEDILEAKLVNRRSDAIVTLAVRGKKSLALRMDIRDARAMVDVLGARRTRFRLVVPFGKRFLAFVGLFAGATFFVVDDHALWVMALPGLLLWAALAAVLAGFLRGRLVVGADGFTVRWAFRERFVAFRDVATVQGKDRFGDAGTKDTLVQLASGKKVRLRALEVPNTEEDRGAESRALLGHVSDAFRRSRELQDGTVDLPTLVERGTRSPGEWLSGLDALVRGGGSRYRVAAVSAEMLAQVVGDPSATVESRVGASAALVRMDDEALRTRVRVAAEGCAASELRDTLLALADARDDVAAEAALAKVARR